MTLSVAIVGRPNVGKSTLFNRLAGQGKALVHNRPGVTRDRREGRGAIADLAFTVVDTAGLEDAFDESLAGRARSQTERAIAGADIVLFLIDARAGVIPGDAAIARHLRKVARKVILVANKCEGRVAEAGLADAFSLGLGEAIAVSAAHAHCAARRASRAGDGSRRERASARVRVGGARGGHGVRRRRRSAAHRARHRRSAQCR
jgi:GTP-binding protein